MNGTRFIQGRIWQKGIAESTTFTPSFFIDLKYTRCYMGEPVHCNRLLRRCRVERKVKWCCSNESVHSEIMHNIVIPVQHLQTLSKETPAPTHRLFECSGLLGCIQMKSAILLTWLRALQLLAVLNWEMKGFVLQFSETFTKLAPRNHNETKGFCQFLSW